MFLRLRHVCALLSRANGGALGLGAGLIATGGALALAETGNAATAGSAGADGGAEDDVGPQIGMRPNRPLNPNAPPKEPPKKKPVFSPEFTLMCAAALSPVFVLSAARRHGFRSAEALLPLAGLGVTGVGYLTSSPERGSPFTWLGFGTIIFGQLGYSAVTRRRRAMNFTLKSEEFIRAVTPVRHPLTLQRLTGNGYLPLSGGRITEHPGSPNPRRLSFLKQLADGTPAAVSTGQPPTLGLARLGSSASLGVRGYITGSHDFARVVALSDRVYSFTFGARSDMPMTMDFTPVYYKPNAEQQQTIDRIHAAVKAKQRIQIIQAPYAMPPLSAPQPTATSTAATAPAADATASSAAGAADANANAPANAPAEAIVAERVKIGGESVVCWDATVTGFSTAFFRVEYSRKPDEIVVDEYIDCRYEGARFLLHGGPDGPLPATNPKAGPAGATATATATSTAATN